jgi:DNA-binding NtrC family response regulator
MRWKVFCQERVELDDLSPEILAPNESGSVAQVSKPADGALQTTLADAVRAAERRAIEQTLRAQQGNVSRTAAALGIDRHTLKRKLLALQIDREVGQVRQGVKEAKFDELGRG